VKRVVWMMPGPFPGRLVTPALVRRPSQPRLSVQWETEAPLTVVAEARTLGRWDVRQAGTGTAVAFLVKPGRDSLVRLVITGTSPGWLRLVEV
jgi:hypothetical protein